MGKWLRNSGVKFHRKPQTAESEQNHQLDDHFQSIHQSPNQHEILTIPSNFTSGSHSHSLRNAFLT